MPAPTLSGTEALGQAKVDFNRARKAKLVVEALRTKVGILFTDRQIAQRIRSHVADEDMDQLRYIQEQLGFTGRDISFETWALASYLIES